LVIYQGPFLRGLLGIFVDGLRLFGCISIAFVIDWMLDVSAGCYQPEYWTFSVIFECSLSMGWNFGNGLAVFFNG
jgi:hypothetical protein